MELYKSFTEWEDSFDGQPAVNWTRNHREIPVFAVGFYLWFIFYFPKMQEWGVIPKVELKLKTLFACWNAALSIFSIIGASRVVPNLYNELTNSDYGLTFSERFYKSVCDDPKPRHRDGTWCSYIIVLTTINLFILVHLTHITFIYSLFMDSYSLFLFTQHRCCWSLGMFIYIF